MLIARLLSLIEDHADELTARLVRKLRKDPRTSEYRRFDEAELGRRAHHIYAHLGRWLERSSEGRVEEEYFRLGETRRAEGIALSQVVSALLMTRRNLWQYVDSLGVDTILELRQQFELELLVVRFFDRAIYHTVRGYESTGQ